MDQQLIHHDAALRLFFTEEIYLQQGEGNPVETTQSAEQPMPVDVETRDTAIEADVVSKTPPELEKQERMTKPETRVFKYLGKNQAQILILVHDEQEDVSSPDGRELLRNLVKAIQLTANDFALLNYAAYQQTQHVELFNFFKPRLLLSFGISAGQLGLAEMESDVLLQVDGIQMVFSDNLARLASDQERKKILWGSLKKLQL